MSRKILGVSGIASLYRMGDPLNVRLTGIVINQPDLPWWCVGILNWLGMVHAMQQASGDIGKTYRGTLTHVLENGGSYPYTNVKTGRTVNLSGPAAIYGVYQSFCAKVEMEMNK